MKLKYCYNNEGNAVLNKNSEILFGGNLNTPIKKDNYIVKNSTEASETIHELLIHIRKQGIDWVPESHGIDNNGKHVFTYIEGVVPHDMPDWIWKENIIKDIAIKLRQWHDATVTFKKISPRWLFETDEIHEVICHNDFAPYNCVFKNYKFCGIIDFDLCSPGSRIWDIAYTAYRFIPLMPDEKNKEYFEYSPFKRNKILERLEYFLEEYSCNDKHFFYDINTVIRKTQKRLIRLAQWSKEYALKTNNEEIEKNAIMYLLHGKWIENLLYL